jgi:predicted ester cyclase
MTTIIEPQELLTRMFDEIFNEGQIEKVDEYFTEDFVEHTVMGDLHGREAFKQFVGVFKQGFPDGRNEVLDSAVAGDVIYWTVRFTGTNDGEFNNMPPTGRSVDILVLNKAIIRDGRGAEHWTGDFGMQMMQQLGLMPAQPVPAT